MNWSVRDAVIKLLEKGLTLRWRFRWTGFKMPKRWQYFTDEEVKGLDIELVSLLDLARDRAKVPFILTSGFRTPEANWAAGGKDNSAHLRGLAVDIRCGDSYERFQIIRALYFVGFRRIGDYEDHVHADIDTTLPQDVLWVA